MHFYDDVAFDFITLCYYLILLPKLVGANPECDESSTVRVICCLRIISGVLIA